MDFLKIFATQIWVGFQLPWSKLPLFFFSFERKLGPGAVDRVWWKWVEMANARVWIFRQFRLFEVFQRVSRAPICNVAIYETIHVEDVLCLKILHILLMQAPIRSGQQPEGMTFEIIHCRQIKTAASPLRNQHSPGLAVLSCFGIPHSKC